MAYFCVGQMTGIAVFFSMVSRMPSMIGFSQSVVWDEAENRLHVQKALMEYLLLGKIKG